MKNRIFLNKNGTLTDLTIDLGDYQTGTGTINVDKDTDYIYIGQSHPFNNLYFLADTVNTSGATLSIKLWDGSSEWKSVAELSDETNGFNNSGFITWVPDKNEQWGIDDTVDANGDEEVTGFGTTVVYDRYWLRISTDTNLDAGTKLSWAGNLFCTDEDLYSEYAQFRRTSYLTGWQTGKTTWEEQRVSASKYIIEEMIKKNVIDFSGQILAKELFTGACIARTAEIIFVPFGDDYEDDRSKAMVKFHSRMNLRIFKTDKNKDGRLSQSEKNVSTGILNR